MLVLIGDGNVSLSGGDQFGRIVRVGWGNEFHIKTPGSKKTFFLGHKQRRMVRIDKPVEQHGHFVSGCGW